MPKFKWMKWALLAIGFLTLAYVLVRYLIYIGKIQETEFWTYLKNYGGIGLIIILGIIGLVYWMNNWLYNIDDAKKPYEIVDTQPLIDAWLPEFIKRTNIPYKINYDSKMNPHIIPAKEEMVAIENTQIFSQEKTGIPYFKFECLSKAGNHRGINFVIIRRDEGKEKVVSNWNQFIKRHMPEEKFRLEREYPLGAINDEAKRIEIVKAELRQEGAMEDEINYLSRIKRANQTELLPAPSEDELLTDEEKELAIQTKQIDNLKRLEKSRK